MIAVIAMYAHTVRVVFADGEVRDVDITPLLATPAFAALRDPAVFERVAVDPQSDTIAWPGGVDLCPDVIYAAQDLGPQKPRIHALVPDTHLPLDELDLKLLSVEEAEREFAALPRDDEG